MEQIEDQTLLQTVIRENKLDAIFHAHAENRLKLYKLQRGEIVCEAGDRLTHMYFLVQGRLKIFTTLANGKSLLLRFSNPLSIVGEVEFVTQHAAFSTVQSVQEGLLVGMDIEDIVKRDAHRPEFLHYLLRHVCHKLETVSHSTSVNQLYPLEQRFASYLVATLSGEHQTGFAEEIRTSNLMEIAELLGSSYRHLNRIIAEFAAQGLIGKKEGKLYIRNIEKLKELTPADIYK